ncbi:enoyl-CoA hydratase/isomerase family protein [Pseudomonas sp. LB3P14]
MNNEATPMTPLTPQELEHKFSQLLLQTRAMPDPDDNVLLEFAEGGRVAIISFNRPDAFHAITNKMATRLGEIIKHVSLQTQVRCVIVTGTGNNFGGVTDLSERGSFTAEERRQQRLGFDQVSYAIRNMKKPIFAAVHGYSGSGAMELAIGMDFIIAADNATFNLPDAIVGIANASGGSVFLPRVLSPGKAMEMMMTGELITAQEAHRLGMVNHVVPKAQLMPLALEIARKIVHNSPTAIEAQKQAMKYGYGQPTEMAIQLSQMTNARAAVHPDYAEGIQAFLERREARFKDSDQ